MPHFIAVLGLQPFAEDEVDMASAELLPVHNFTQLQARHDIQLQTTPLPFSAHLQDVYNSNEFNLHINHPTPALRTTPQHTKFYIPLTIETTAFSLQERMMTLQSVFSTPRPLQNQQHAFCHYTHYRASYISRRTTDYNYCVWQLMPICGITTA